jgi:hypothetical protein
VTNAGQKKTVLGAASLYVREKGGQKRFSYVMMTHTFGCTQE